MKILLSALIIFLTIFTSNLFSQPGTLDTSFGINGKIRTDIDAADNVINSVLAQPDGKIIAIGYSSPAPYIAYISLARYNANGTLDNSFGTNGIVKTQFGTDEDKAYSGIIQVNGKIVSAGYSWNGFNYDFILLRYNADGSLDNNFGINGITTTDFNNNYDRAVCSVLQPDGKIIVAGNSFADPITMDLDFALACYLPDGTLDNNFGTNGKLIFGTDPGLQQAVRAITLQPDGKIIIAGFTEVIDELGNLKKIFALARLNTNGFLDNSFGTSGIATTSIGPKLDIAASVAIQSDGKILALGSTRTVGGYDDFAIARYNTNGTLDNSFGAGGIVTTAFNNTDDAGSSITLQPDGKILAAGMGVKNDGSDVDFALARYNINGILDNSFGVGGKVVTDFGSNLEFANSMTLQPDGKIMVAGFSKNNKNYDFVIAKYNSELNTDANNNCLNPANSTFIYPNPIIQNTTLEYTLCKDEKVSIYLTDTKGRKLKEFVVNKMQNSGKHLQHLLLPRNIPAGVYFIVLAIANKQMSIKVIK